MAGEKKDQRIPVMMAVSEVARIDAWRSKRPELPPRAEAIRRLVALGIGGEPILRDLLDMMEKLPHDGDLDKHIRAIRLLVDKATASD